MKRNLRLSDRQLINLLKFIFVFLCILGWHGTNTLQAQNCSVNAGVFAETCEGDELSLFGAKSGLFFGDGTTTWSQVSGPSATIVNPNSLITEVTNLIGGQDYVFRLSTRCQDGSFVFQDVTKRVSPVTEADAGEGFTACPDDENAGQLSANAPGDGETGEWSIIGAANGVSINDLNDPNTTLSFAGTACGETTLRWTITADASGCESFDDVVVINRGGVSPVSAGDEQELSQCYSTTQSTSLNGSFAGCPEYGQQGVWTVISGPNVPNINNPNNNNTNVSNLIEGTYRFRWTVSGTCASGFDEMEVIVPEATADITQADAGDNQAYCEEVTSTVLSGNAPLYVNEEVEWVQTEGPTATIVNPNLPVTQVTGLDGSSTYEFSYTISNDVTDCSSTSNVTISYFEDAPSITIDEKPILMPCDETTAVIPFTAGGTGNTQYRILSGPALEDVTYPTGWTNAGGSPVEVTGLTERGEYRFQFRRTNTLGIDCDDAFDEVSVIISITSPEIISNAGTDQILDCNVYSTNLQGNDPVVQFGLTPECATWSQVSGPSQVILTNPNDPTLEITDLSPGLYVFQWCLGGGPACDPVSDTVTILVAEEIPIAAIAGEDQTVCTNSPVFLDADETQFIFETGNWSVQPSEGIEFSDENDPKATATGLQPFVTYTFIWTVTNGCGSASDTMTIDVSDDVGPIAAHAGDDQCLEAVSTSTFLDANHPEEGTGTWNVISTPAGASSPTFSPDVNTHDAEISDLVTGTYELEWVITTVPGCEPTRDQVTITVGAVTEALAGSDISVCGTSVLLEGNVPGSGETGEWTLFSGSALPPGSIASPTHHITEVYNLAPLTYRFAWTITNGACESNDVVRVSVSHPPVEATVGPNQDLCEQSSTTLEANAVPDGFWTVQSGPNSPNFNDFTNPVTSVSNLVMGTYVMKWNSASGPHCPPSTATMTLEVVPAADAGADQTYCEEITTINLIGNAASSGTWTQLAGPEVTITTISANTATASGLVASEPGQDFSEYEFVYTIDSDTCTTSDTMTVTLYEPPSTAAAGSDQFLCDAGTFQMEAEDATFGTGTWSKLLGPAGETGSFSNVNDPDAIYTPADNIYGLYVFQWTVANGDCSNADQVRIENFEPPSVADAGADFDIVCDTEVIMAANDPDVGLGTWTLTMKTGDAPDPVITSPILYNTTITGMGPQSNGDPAVYTFSWTISSGGVCTPTVDEVSLTVYETPTPADAGDDQEFCNQASTTLAADEATVGTGAWTVISMPDGATDPGFDPNINAHNATITGLTNGVYVLEWQTETDFCTSTDTMTITNWAEPSPADAGQDAVVCQFDELFLNAADPTVGSGEWARVSGPNNPIILDKNAPNTQVLGVVTGTYVFSWSVSHGVCATSSDTVTIDIVPEPDFAQVGADMELCNATSAEISGNEPEDFATGTWSVVSIDPPGPGVNTPTFVDENSHNTTINGLVPASPRTYVVRWTIATGDCEKFDEMEIRTWEEPSEAVAGDDIILCDENSVTIEANDPDVGTGEWVRISGPNNPTIVNTNSPTTTVTGIIPSTVSYVFRWRVSNGPECDPSDDFVEVLNRLPISITVTDDLEVCDGAQPELEVTATGGSGNYTYQWQESTGDCDGTWEDITGATDQTFTTPALAEATGTYYYRVIVSDEDDICETTSECVVITVVEDPFITSQPDDDEICVGGSTTFTVAADGGTPSLDYQWQFWDGTDWIDVVDGTPAGANYTGANASSMTVSDFTADDTYEYRVEVSAEGIGCATVFSDVVSVIVQPNHEIEDDPEDATICIGTTHTMNVTIDPATGTGNYTYLWQESVTGTGGWNAAPGTNDEASYTSPALSETRHYRVRVRSNDSGCNDQFSEVATVYVPHITVQPVTNVVDDEVCVSSDVDHEAILSVETEEGDPTNSIEYDYQWEYWDGSSWSAVANGTPSGAEYSGGNSTDLTVEGIDAVGEYDYRVIINPTNPDCDPITSDIITLNVVGDPLITNQPEAETTICPGETAELEVVAIEGTPALLYQWQISTDPAPYDWTDISGATDPTYETEALSETRYYRVEVTAAGSGCATTFSDPSVVIVNRVTSPGSIAAEQTICEDDTPGELTNTDPATGDGDISYQWQESDDGVGFTDIPGADDLSYLPPALTEDTWYRRMAISTLDDVSCELASNMVLITVNPIPQITSNDEVTICDQSSVNYLPTSDVVGTTFEWTASTDDEVTGFSDGSGTTISDALTNNEIGNVTAVVIYEIVPIGPGPTNCRGATFTFTVNVEKCADLAIVKTDGETEYTPGTDVVYTITVSNLGPSSVTGATVEDIAPTGTTIGTWTAEFSAGASGEENGSGNIDETVDMDAGSIITYTLTVSVPSGFEGDLANTATIEPPAGVNDENPDNNTSTDTNNQNSIADLGVTKAVDNPTPIVGENVVFTIEVTNHGPSDASGIEVVDYLPSGYGYVEDDGGTNTSESGGTVTWNIPSLPFGATETLTITAEVLAPTGAPDEYNNTVEITDLNEDDDNETNDEASVNITPMTDSFGVEVWVYLEGASVVPGDCSEYTLVDGDGLMRTDLNDLRLLPGQTSTDPFYSGDTHLSPVGQPYDTAPWDYGGTEGDSFDSTGSPTANDAGYDSDVVDWVLVSIRQTPGESALAGCVTAALLRNDGSIEFLGGAFTGCNLTLAQEYHIVVEHRNHLPVMSVPIEFDGSDISFDFRSNVGDDPQGQKDIATDLFVMFGGNGNQLGDTNGTTIDNADRIIWQSQNGTINRYRIGDYDMNGDTNESDRNLWIINDGESTDVPWVH